MRRRRSPGLAIGALLALALACLVLAFIVTSLATFQLNASLKSALNDEALFLAEGALAQTMSRIHDGMKPPAAQFGRSGELVTYNDPTRPGALGQVSFDPATSWGYSTNNYDGTRNTGWHGETIPKGMVQVVAQGVVGNCVRTVEAFLQIPTFQYVLSVDGPLDTNGSPLSARCESSMASLAANVQANTPNTTLGANIGSNTSISLGINSNITGDVVCPDPAQILISAPSTVGGVVRQGNVSIPRTLKVQSYSFGNAGTPLLSANPPGDIGLTVDTYAPQSITVPGDLNIENCTLYVNGDLTVNSLDGTGAIFVNGNVIVNGGADLSAYNMVALMTSGNVTLNGAAGPTKYFQGMVYTEGAFSASNITIAGSFVSINHGPDNPAGTSSGLTLNNVQVIYVPTSATVAPNAPVSVANICPSYHSNNWCFNPLPPGQFIIGAVTSDNAIDISLKNAINGGMKGNSTWPQIMAPNANPMPNPSDICFRATAHVGTDYYDVAMLTEVYDPVQKQMISVNPPTFAYRMDGHTVISQATYDWACQQAGLPFTSTQVVPALLQAHQILKDQVNALLLGGMPGSGSVATVPPLMLNNFLTDSSPLHIVAWREH